MTGKQRINIRQPGFTLIELLVVISAIALLSTVVLVAVGSARSKALDQKIITSMLAIPKQADVYLGAKTDTYDYVCANVDNTLCNTGAGTDCTAGPAGAATAFGNIEKEIMAANGNKTVRCRESTDKKAFAVSSPLVYLSGYYWCIDSRGFKDKFAGTEIPAGACVATSCACQ